MLFQDLFNAIDTDCPEWLSEEPLDDDWADSEYAKVGTIHTWTIKNPGRHLVITFDGETCVYTGFHPEYNDLVLMQKTITEDTVCIS
jgi:hypothetical protein